MVFGRVRLPVKTEDELRAMRRAGLVVGRALEHLREICRPGMTTAELDAEATRFIVGQGARPNFSEVPGYRHTLCTSVNEAVVHGIPSGLRLEDGDLLSIDCGAIVDGWHGDSAITIEVGSNVSPQARALSEATRESMWAGIAAFQVGGRLYDIGAAVEESIESARDRDGLVYGIVDGYEGHGIGREMHMEPGVPNVRVRGRGPHIEAGATVAIEPMITLGSEDTVELADGWTAVTTDGSWASHWEHTVAATADGLWVLTALDGGEAELTRRGLPFGPVGE